MRSGAGLPRLLRGVSAVASAKAGCRNVAIGVTVHGLTLFLPSNFLTRLIPNDIAALSKKRKKKEAKSYCGEKGKLLTCLISSSSFLLRLPSSLCASDPEILDFGKSHGNCEGRKTAESPIPKVSHRAQFWIFF